MMRWHKKAANTFLGDTDKVRADYDQMGDDIHRKFGTAIAEIAILRERVRRLEEFVKEKGFGYWDLPL